MIPRSHVSGEMLKLLHSIRVTEVDPERWWRWEGWDHQTLRAAALQASEFCSMDRGQELPERH